MDSVQFENKKMIHQTVGIKSLLDSIHSFNGVDSITNLLKNHLLLNGQDPALFNFQNEDTHVQLYESIQTITIVKAQTNIKALARVL